jgi:hypothetical protein
MSSPSAGLLAVTVRVSNATGHRCPAADERVFGVYAVEFDRPVAWEEVAGVATAAVLAAIPSIEPDGAVIEVRSGLDVLVADTEAGVRADAPATRVIKTS